MKTNLKSLPEIVNKDEWLSERKALLKEEKEFAKQHEKINAKRRQLPMVEIEKDYFFEGSDGTESLLGLFKGRGQLIIQHFMFEPDWDEGCPGCSLQADNVGHLAHLHARDVTLVLVSKAPLEKLERFKERMGWTLPWYSSYESDFNYDFHVTIDPDRGSAVYNYEDVNTMGESWKGWKGEMSGTSVFIRKGDRIFHTYSTYARGTELLNGTLLYLDLTPFGRQEDWEKPDGRGNDKPGGWWHRHDQYQKE